MVRKSKKLKFTRKTALISVAAVVVVIGLGLGWHYHNRPSQEVIVSTPSKSTAPLQNSSSSQSSSSVASGSDKTSAPAATTNSSSSSNPTDGTDKPPVAPTGQFVSSHQLQNAQTPEQSACNTTPGASCYIKFTKGNDTQTLVAQITDTNGTTIWNWNTSTLGSGSWQVAAVATLNGQTATATDAQPLVVP